MLRGPIFTNEIGHIKTVKRITRTVDFGIPTIEIFLNGKVFWCTLGIIDFFNNIHTNIWNLTTF